MGWHTEAVDLAADALQGIAMILLMIGGTGLFLGWSAPNFTKEEARLKENVMKDIYGSSRYRRHRAGFRQFFYAGVVTGLGAAVLHLVNLII